jgi:hypothetical protein
LYFQNFYTYQTHKCFLYYFLTFSIFKFEKQIKILLIYLNFSQFPCASTSNHKHKFPAILMADGLIYSIYIYIVYLWPYSVADLCMYIHKGRISRGKKIIQHPINNTITSNLKCLSVCVTHQFEQHN